MNPSARPTLLLACIASLALIASAGCSSPGAAASGKPGAGEGKGKPGEAGGLPHGPLSFPVEVRPVSTRDVQYELDAIGSVEAFERVQVTARVQGVVEKVQFAEGEQVKAGALLAEIEPQRFQVAVRSAQAALERARASKADADAGLRRREQALSQSPGLIPAEELESWRTKQALAEAERLSAQAAYDQAALNLRDARVRAPVTGTIETRNVQTGQYAQPGTVLATLVRRDPLLLRFNVAEADANKLQRGQVVHFGVRGSSIDDAPALRGGAGGEFDATVTHVGGLADTSSRMVQVTAEVSPAQRDRLRPGAFAEVRVPIGNSGNAPVVPEVAVRPSEKGFLAYVVEGDVAHERVLDLGMHTPDGQVEVRAGLEPGDKLVVRGAEALKDGAKIRVVPPAGTAPGATPAPEKKPLAEKKP